MMAHNDSNCEQSDDHQGEDNCSQSTSLTLGNNHLNDLQEVNTSELINNKSVDGSKLTTNQLQQSTHSNHKPNQKTVAFNSLLPIRDDNNDENNKIDSVNLSRHEVDHETWLRRKQQQPYIVSDPDDDDTYDRNGDLHGGGMMMIESNNSERVPRLVDTVANNNKRVTVRIGSVDDSVIYYDQNKSTVYDYLASSFNSTSGAIIRSNSFTHQDVGRHRKNIQASFASGLVTNEEDEDLLPFQGARRLSKSLPELNQLRILPHFVEAANQYNVIFESDQDEDEEDNISSCIATDTEYQPAWASKSDFFLTILGFSLAINTFWRFPYYAYINDGGSFLMVYTFLMIFIGLPLLCMDYAIGQLTHRNLIVFAHLCPLTKGIVISLALTTSILIPLYSTINTWSMLYFFKSFHQIPPWSRCTNKWNTEPCQLNDRPLITSSVNNNQQFINNSSNKSMLNNNLVNLSVNIFNSTKINSSLITNEHHSSSLINNFTSSTPSTMILNKSSTIHTINLSFEKSSTSSSSSIISSQYASQQFFDNRLLNFDYNVSLGVIRWDLAICLFFIWFIVFISLRKPYIFSSNPSFCLAIVPTTVFSILFFKAIFLPGAQKGLVFFFKPTWEGISQPEVWLYAAGFTIHSLGSITGLSLGMAKYHRNRNNLMRDAILTCSINFLIIYSIGSIYFATIGHLAYKRQIDINQVVTKEPGIAFVVISELLALMPMRTLWSCFFFFLIFCLGMDYQIAIVATIVDCIKDIWRSRFSSKISHQLVVFFVLCIFFCLSLFFLTQNGIVFIRVTEHYITVILSTILALLEIVIVSNFYGAKNMVNAIRLITYKAPGFYFSFCWKFVSPCVLLVILIFNLYYFEEVTFRGIKDSFTVDLLGPLIAMIVLLPIPLLACHELRRKENDSSGFFKRLSLAFQPINDPISEMKRENIGHKRHNSFEEETNSRGNLSCDIINPVISSYPLLQNLNRETTV